MAKVDKEAAMTVSPRQKALLVTPLGKYEKLCKTSKHPWWRSAELR